MNINRINQVIHLYTNVGYKTNQMQTMFPDYGKLWYADKDISNIFLLNNFVNEYRGIYDSHQDDDSTIHTNIGVISSV